MLRTIKIIVLLLTATALQVSATGWGQSTIMPAIDVKGRVVNENNEPVAGASIQVKGESTKGTTTDTNGYFVLKGVDENATLIISATNIESVEIKVNGKNDLATIIAKIKMTLEEEAVVNTGYQKLKANELTGSVVQISNEQLNRITSTDILSRLQNVSGLLLKSGRENFQDRDNIVIRGYSTILSERQPLIVVDNFPYEGDINAINPNDIENMTILKDAAATSIWGTRAANGVIVITTKTGKYNQKLKVSFNGNITFVEEPDLFYAPILSSSDFIDVETFLFNKGYYNSSVNSRNRPALTPGVEVLLKRRNGQISAADSTMQIDALRDFDIRDDLLRYYYQKQIRQQYAAELMGGSENQKYFLSTGYDYNINSISDYRRISVNATNTYTLLNKKLEFTSGIFISQTKSGNQSEFTGNYPYAELADEKGNPLPIARYRTGYIDTAGGGKLLDWTYYPLRETGFSDNRITGFNYTINMGLKYKVLKGLSIEMKGQLLRQQTENRNFYSLQTFSTRDLINRYTNLAQTTSALRNPVPIGSILDLRNTVYISKNLRGQVNYNAVWNEHMFSSIAGVDISQGTSNSSINRAYGYDEKNGTSIPVDYISSFKQYIGNSSLRVPYVQDFRELTSRSISIYGNAQYTYKQRYIIYASARRDGSNLLGASTNNKWKPLWSIGGNWKIDKESFYNPGFLSLLHLRASYGHQGNVNNSVPALLTILYSSAVNGYNLPYAAIQNHPNPDLRWENVSQFNIALDYSSTSNRISGNVEFYYKKGIDLIGSETLPPSSGVIAAKANSANMKAKGVDIVLNTLNLAGKIKWNTAFIFSYSRDWVTDYKLEKPTIQDYIQSGNTINPIIGKPVSALYSYKWAGLDPDTGDPLGYINGEISKEYFDLTTSANLNDIVYNGPSTPPYFGSILNAIGWKDFSISFSITYKFGYFFRAPSIRYSNLFSKGDAGHTDYLLRWQNPGDEQFTNVPSMIYPADVARDNFYQYSEILVEKGDHVRFQDIRLNYDITKQRFTNLPFQNIRAYIYVSNIGIIWRANKKGIDPDFIPDNSYMSYLPGKSITAGLKIDF